MSEEDDLNTSHCTVETIARLLPGVSIAGGSFSHWLPDPKTLAPSERRAVVKAAKVKATNCCLRTLLRLENLPGESNIGRLPGGSRDWPNGRTGSLTNKGTVVLGAMAPLSKFRAIGIDLERDDGKDLSGIAGLVGVDEIPIGSNVSHSLLFSTKESVFKAQHPITNLLLSFSDIQIRWSSLTGSCFSGVAIAPNGFRLDVVASTSDGWICSAATIRQ
jgi:4'-phosphopantetheinyl transferase EntD